MIATLLISLSLAASMTDPIALAQEHFARIDSYRVTLRSWSQQGDYSVIGYSYRRPGAVRIDFEEPHRGAALAYSPETKKVLLRPFGPGAFPLLTLAPDNPLILSPSGHRVDQSDVGSLLRNVRALQQGGSMQQEEVLLNGQLVLQVTVAGTAGRAIDGVHQYRLWLERTHWFPLKVISQREDGTLLETVLMDNVQFDVSFPENFFNP